MTVLIIAIVIVCLFLIALVLIQKSKGGGLASGFQGSNQIMGAPKTADFLEKATWTLMGIIAVLCIISSLLLEAPTADTTSVKEIVSEQAAFPENTVESSQEATESAAPAPSASENATEAE